MSVAELYPWLKALHVASALTFVGGVLAAAVFLAAASEGTAAMTGAARAVWRWDQAVTTPAMLFTWGLGLALAISGNWFAETWLWAKLVFVIVLSGVHGVQSGQLRGLAGGTAVRSLRMTLIILGSTLVIAILAVVKPA